MPRKVIKQPNHVILATDFKRIGRSTSIERGYIQAFGMSTKQLYDSGLVKDVKDMFSDGKITPPEKEQLSRTFDNIKRDFAITIKQAQDLNIPFNEETSYYKMLNDYLTLYVLQDMSSTYIIKSTDPNIDDLINGYNAEMNELNETLSETNTEKGYYGSILVTPILRKQIGQEIFITDSIDYGEEVVVNGAVYYKGNETSTPVLQDNTSFSWRLTGFNFKDDRYEQYYNPRSGWYENLYSFSFEYDEVEPNCYIEVSCIVDTEKLH